MMYEAIKFDLSGRNAFFKKPDVNSKVYFTYNNIHKVALLGLLGAIIGLRGWRNYKLFDETPPKFPEFFMELQNLSVSVFPLTPKGYFSKKIQYFNNSVGYASKEEGGNLQVFEQWLENPEWTIYLKNDGIKTELWDTLRGNLINGNCTYIPYLGKNDFPATLKNVQSIKLYSEASCFIDSIFIGDLNLIHDNETRDNKSPYMFTEFAPISLVQEHNFYTYTRTLFTNCMVKEGPSTFMHDNRILSFV